MDNRTFDISWPAPSESAKSAVLQPFENQRFSISGYWTGQEPISITFASEFAKFNGSRHCVCTSNGTSALTISLEALGIGYGDEVIVPALTWHAPATAVLNVNAFPVLVDVLEDSYCIDPAKIRAVITSKTKAIMVVHLYGSMAEMDEILAIAKEYGLFIIEDCAQVHGSVYGGRRAGTMGDIGMFSFHQGKIMSAGEGGAVITDSEERYLLLQQLRADSRLYVKPPSGLKYGGRDLENTGGIQGNNHALSEFQAAVLMEQLAGFDAIAEKKMRNAEFLDEGIRSIPGLRPMGRPAKVSLQTYYGYVFKLDRLTIGFTAEELSKRIIEKLGIGEFFVHPAYLPVHQSPLFCPWTKKRFVPELSRTKEYWRSLSFPIAQGARKDAVVFHHSVLLQEPANLQSIVDCIREIVTEP